MTSRNDHRQPVLLLIAGSNGAGKTTLASSLRMPLPVVNADTIMLELQCSPLAAGRMALRQLHRHLAKGRSCIYETTLSGRGLLRQVEQARRKGFVCALHYVGLDNARMAVERVRTRHSSGQGHFVPEEDVMRRHERSHDNLPVFMNGVDLTVLYDNSRTDFPFIEVCRVRDGEVFMKHDLAMPRWVDRALGRWRRLRGA